MNEGKLFPLFCTNISNVNINSVNWNLQIIPQYKIFFT